MINRREFLASSTAIAGTVIASSVLAKERQPPNILLRSSWQMVNIGDIAHTPGVIALLEKYIPEAKVTLWASGSHSEEVARMEQSRFPKLKIVKGRFQNDGIPSTPELADAIKSSDLLLHGSGPSLVAYKDVAAFVQQTGKPFGVYGITYSGAEQAQRDLLSQAKFVFFRDSVSLAKAKSEGIRCPIMQFGPDGAFAVDLKNEAAADALLAMHDLQPGKFLCCIPRLRNTPYWKIRNKEMTETDIAKQARNQEMADHDHRPLRKAIIAVVRETDHKVLLCPEDMSQMEVGREWLFEKLPADVQQQVAWKKDFWLTDEALSVYRKSSGLFGLEMHSPIMCIGNGIPAIVCRFQEQTSKGFMWKDIGLDDWLFDMDIPGDCDDLSQTVLNLINHRQAALNQVQAAQQVVHTLQAETMQIVESAMSST